MQGVEERKARALRDAGFDMDLDGKDSHSIQYQNANNSVRVTDEFMQAVVDDGDWELKAVTDRRGAPDGQGARPDPPDRRRRRGSAPTPACSSTPRSTAGTPRPTPAASTPATHASPGRHAGAHGQGTDPIRRSARPRYAAARPSASTPTTRRTSMHRRNGSSITTTRRGDGHGLQRDRAARFSNGMELRCTPGTGSSRRTAATSRRRAHALMTRSRCWTCRRRRSRADWRFRYRRVCTRLPAGATSSPRRLPAAREVDAGVRALPRLAGRRRLHLGGRRRRRSTAAEDEQATILPAHQELLAAWMNGGDELEAVGPGERHDRSCARRRRVIARFFEAPRRVAARSRREKVVP